jgi:hypothetical protein
VRPGSQLLGLDRAGSRSCGRDIPVGSCRSVFPHTHSATASQPQWACHGCPSPVIDASPQYRRSRPDRGSGSVAPHSSDHSHPPRPAFIRRQPRKAERKSQAVPIEPNGAHPRTSLWSSRSLFPRKSDFWGQRQNGHDVRRGTVREIQRPGRPAEGANTGYLAPPPEISAVRRLIGGGRSRSRTGLHSRFSLLTGKSTGYSARFTSFQEMSRKIPAQAQ